MVRLSARRRAFLRQVAQMPIEAVNRRARILRGKDQHYVIAGAPVILPPAHRLPFYQSRDATYDAYALPLLERLAAGRDSLTVLDVGANVGDTPVMALQAGPNVRVRAVEGDALFLRYLRSNVLRFGDRVEVVPGFVGPLPGNWQHFRDGSTGGFRPGREAEVETPVSWLAVSDLLADLPGSVVWKSDTDGFDIPILSARWRDIASRCDVVWMEFDPVGTRDSERWLPNLIDAIADSERLVHVYDNVGVHMVSCQGSSARQTLWDLTGWLRQRRSGVAPVLYLDVWIAESSSASAMWP